MTDTLKQWSPDLLVPVANIEAELTRMRLVLKTMTELGRDMAPTLILFKDGVRVGQIMLRRFATDQGKLESFSAGFASILAFDADAVMFFADAWWTSPDQGEPLVRPSEDPNRREALTVTYVDRNYDVLAAQYPYGRNASNPRELIFQEGDEHYGTIIANKVDPHHPENSNTSGIIVDLIIEIFSGKVNFIRDDQDPELLEELGAENLNQAFLTWLRGHGYVVTEY